MKHTLRRTALMLACGLLFPLAAHGGAQRYMPLSDSVRSVLQLSISDKPPSDQTYAKDYDAQVWIADMSFRLSKRMPNLEARSDFLSAVLYESTRAGLDPQMVLGLIEVESGFRKYAVSHAGARGYMQVMPFWVNQIGAKGQDLFHLRTNLRFGCTILRFYIDLEKGDLFRALGRYNGSLGKPEYPNRVKAAWHKHWNLERTLSSLDPIQLADLN